MSFLETPLVLSFSGSRAGLDAKKIKGQTNRHRSSVGEEDGHTVSLDKMLLDESGVSIEAPSRRKETTDELKVDDGGRDSALLSRPAPARLPSIAIDQGWLKPQLKTRPRASDDDSSASSNESTRRKKESPTKSQAAQAQPPPEALETGQSRFRMPEDQVVDKPSIIKNTKALLR